MQVQLPNGLRVDLGETPSPELIGQVQAKIRTMQPDLRPTPAEPPNAETVSTTTTPTTRPLGRALGESVLETGRRLGGAAAGLSTPPRSLGDLGRLAPLLELLSPPMMAGGLAGETIARRRPTGLTPEQGRLTGQLVGGGPALVRGAVGLGGRALGRVRAGLPAVQQRAAETAASTESGRRLVENAAAAISNVGRIAARPGAGRSVKAISQTRMLNKEEAAQQAIAAADRTRKASSVGPKLRALNQPPTPPVTLFDAAGRPMSLRPPPPPPVTRPMIPRGVAAAERAGANAGARAIHFWDTVDSKLGRLGDAAAAKTLARDQDLLNALRNGATPGEARALAHAVEAGTPLRLPYTTAQLTVEPAAATGRSLYATMRNVMIAAGIGGAAGGLPGAIALPAIGKLLDLALSSPTTGRLLATAIRQAPSTAEFARTATALVGALAGPDAAPPRTLGRSAQ